MDEPSFGPFDLDGMDEIPVEEPEAPKPDLLQLALTGENVAEHLDDSQLAELAQDVCDGFEHDVGTMEEWEKRASKGLDLARMVAKEKDYPWAGAANACYPLIAQAALQFNARVYPALVPGDTPVQVKVWGRDEGQKAARAARVSEFMGFQLAISDWEDQIDRLTIQLPIVGTKFRKVFYDPIRGLQTKLCDRVVLDNTCASLEAMPRLSEEFELYEHEIETRIRSGRFVAFDVDVTGDEMAPHTFVEQHCRADLDGDGYPEPWIVTVHRELQKVVRVVGNFSADDVNQQPGEDGQPQIVRIAARDHYVPYHFLPSMDGTFLGVGLGHLLDNTSELINGIINQVLDSGHMASLGGGFLGTGLNLKGGPVRLRPGEYKPVPSSGASIRDSIVPMNFPGPSPVLFQMLGLLIEAGKDVSAISDVMTGDAQRAQPATTTLALIEQGMAVFTAAYKRLYRSMKREFGLMCRINAETVHPEVYAKFHDPAEGTPPPDPARDFALDDLDIQPIADPAQVTNMQRMAKAQLVMEMAQMGTVDPAKATDRVLEAAGVPDREELMPKPDPMQQAQAMMVQALQTRMAELEITDKEAAIAKTVSETEENRAQAMESIAKSQAEQQSMSLNDILRALEVLSMFRTGNDSGRTGRMAGAPADRGSSARPSAGGRQQEVPDLRDVLAVGGEAGLIPRGPVV